MHQQNSETIVTIRQFDLAYEASFDAYVSIQRFNYYNSSSPALSSPVIELPGEFVEVVFASFLEMPGSAFDNYNTDKAVITGANGSFKVYKELSRFCKVERAEGGRHKLVFFNMPNTFSCVIKTKSRGASKEAVERLNRLVDMVNI